MRTKFRRESQNSSLLVPPLTTLATHMHTTQDQSFPSVRTLCFNECHSIMRHLCVRVCVCTFPCFSALLRLILFLCSFHHLNASVATSYTRLEMFGKRSGKLLPKAFSEFRQNIISINFSADLLYLMIETNGNKP